ncbi:UPF0175 family protein [Chroococcus sp. FPU101]|uniref:UPF0175 family protein n=1 Tax=Chroococcus sp. FPU101 TaxID=1974212 RepID=UPI001A8D7D39|nr:UPF0175 family protein [Chroococcus sp. FPU101]GFE70757.1 hypothetical protein CFPU101_33670 [Chroococcus sp. FPU101]
MQITIELPDNLTTIMEQKWGNLSKKILSNLAIEAYQNHLITTAEIGEILNLPSRLKTHAFLKEAGIYINYDEEELQRDLETLQQLRHQ